MHMANTDLVSLKTAVRQLSARLEAEGSTAGQWASIAKNRGYTEAAVRLEAVAGELKKAYANAIEAAERLFEAQQQEASNEHRHT